MKYDSVEIMKVANGYLVKSFSEVHNEEKAAKIHIADDLDDALEMAKQILLEE